MSWERFVHKGYIGHRSTQYDGFHLGKQAISFSRPMREKMGEIGTRFTLYTDKDRDAIKIVFNAEGTWKLHNQFGSRKLGAVMQIGRYILKEKDLNGWIFVRELQP